MKTGTLQSGEKNCRGGSRPSSEASGRMLRIEILYQDIRSYSNKTIKY